MSESAGEDQAQGLVDRAVAEGGAYEVLHKRLLEQGRQLAGLAEALNAQRQQEFGSQPIEVIGRTRVRTENNCIARDIAQVGGLMLFGYNVFIGLKQETRVQDVFSLYRLVQQDGEYDAQPVDPAGSFLTEASFVNDFDERRTKKTVAGGALGFFGTYLFLRGSRFDDAQTAAVVAAAFSLASIFAYSRLR